jgi:hypothetical protein
VTLGQLAPSPTGTAPTGTDFAQVSVTSGTGYVVPANGTITSWSTNALLGTGQSVTFKVFRKVAEPAFYKAVGHDGPRNLAGGLLNTFTTSIPVQAGDIIGMNGTSANILNSAPGDAFVSKPSPGLNDGQAASFTTGSGGRLNLSAVFEPSKPVVPPSKVPPSNAFTVGGTSLNKKKGTATLTLTLPSPGDLTATGNGVSAASAGQAAISKSVGAGTAQLLIKAAGKKKKKLRESGKVTLSVGITFTPTDGTPSTQSVSVKLKKN